MTIRTRALLVFASLFLVVAAACSSDTQSEIRDAADNVTVPASDDGGGGDDSSAEQPSDDGGAEQPSDDGSSGDDGSGGDDSSGGTTPPAPSDDGSGGDDGEVSDQEWAWIVVLGIAAFAIIIFAVAMSSRHSEKKDTARADLDRQLGDIVGTSRWVHDSGSLDVVTTNDPDQLRTVSADVQQRLRDVESQASRVSANTSDVAVTDAMRSLSQASAGLRSAIDGLVTARLASASDDQKALIRTTTQTFNDRRSQFSAATEAVAAVRG